MYQETAATMSMDCKEQQMVTTLNNIKKRYMDDTKISEFVNKLTPLLSTIVWNSTNKNGVYDNNKIGEELADKIIGVLKSMNIDNETRTRIYYQITEEQILSNCIHFYEINSTSFSENMYKYIDSFENDTPSTYENNLENTDIPVVDNSNIQNNGNKDVYASDFIYKGTRKNKRKVYPEIPQNSVIQPQNSVIQPQNSVIQPQVPEVYKSRYRHRNYLGIRKGLSTWDWLLGKKGGKSKRTKRTKRTKSKRTRRN